MNILTTTLIILSTFLLCEEQDTELEDFIEKEIRMYFSGYNSILIGLKEDSNKVSARSKYTNFKKAKFNTSIRIIPSGNKYLLKMGDSFICQEGEILSKCPNGTAFELIRKEFGYTLNNEEECLTKEINDGIRMKKCVGTEDQVINFKSANDSPCGNMKDLFDDKNKDHKTTVNLIPVFKTEDGDLKLRGMIKGSEGRPIKVNGVLNGEMEEEFNNEEAGDFVNVFENQR